MTIILLLTLLYNNNKNINCKIKNYLTIMYNMEISFGSYKCRLEIVLVIIFLIFVDSYMYLFSDIGQQSCIFIRRSRGDFASLSTSKLLKR